jgi:uncharacterized pyridoxal phosphate-dependent enzyme
LTFHKLTDLTDVINARGTFTPLGVSRSSSAVGAAVGDALSCYFVIDELQDLANHNLTRFTGSEAATVTHCCAASITISVAATMTGTSAERIAALPDTGDMADCVVIPAGHCINYGQPLFQAIRLSGARPVLAGTADACSLEDIEQQIRDNKCCCLMLVSSKLVKSEPVDFLEAVKIARKHGVPTIIDSAAQDFRIPALLATGADLVLVSGQKYLASPTAGIVVGQQGLVEAVRAQEKGIGRGMKATKEAIIGVIAAVEERSRLDLGAWQQQQEARVADFIERATQINGITGYPQPDPTGLPFSRAYLTVNDDAPALIAKLKAGSPAIWVIEDKAAAGELGFELVQACSGEIDIILVKLSDLLS